MAQPLDIQFRKVHSELAPLYVWEWPREDCRYYIGADAARGNLDPDGTAKGDFSAAVCWNGTTGNQAFTYAHRLGVSEFAWVLNALGRFYHKAMLNIEQTGGDGSQVQKLIRDHYHYPNLYGWLGKDDRRTKRQGVVLGWETNWKSRQKMLVVLREYIRPTENGEKTGFLKVRDRRLFQQMGHAMRDDLTVRWEIKRGHDDIFVAACVAAVALNQYPPPKKVGESKKLLDISQEQMPLQYGGEPQDRLRNKWLQLAGRVKPPVEDRLAGV